MRFICLAMVLALAANNTHSFGSNLHRGDYPDHYCTAPVKPSQVSGVLNSSLDRSIRSYAMERYRSELEEYHVCLEEYIDYAARDIEMIQEKIHEAEAEFIIR